MSARLGEPEKRCGCGHAAEDHEDRASQLLMYEYGKCLADGCACLGYDKCQFCHEDSDGCYCAEDADDYSEAEQ